LSTRFAGVTVKSVPTKHFVYDDNANGAPGHLEQVRAFLNSVDLEAVRDGLANDRLAEWGSASGLAPAVPERELAELAAFREALRAAVQSNVGDGDAEAAWKAIEPFAQRTCFSMRATERGLELIPLGKESSGAIASILAIVYQAQLEGTWVRLKVCGKHSCRWAFYDRSKNGSGAWCSMAVCGNRVKAAKRRARGAASAERSIRR
jgi:predicted RNA-binding Zn ribbon-like protein